MKALVAQNRSYRRFDENEKISMDQLYEWIDLARLTPSSRNQQALKFMPIVKPDQVADVFKHLAWAGYLPEWLGPIEGERPVAYIVIFGDPELGSEFRIDLGIVAQTMLLGAVDAGYGGCMIGSVQWKYLIKDLGLSEHWVPLLVLALGKPIEQVVIDSCENGDIKYWRDDKLVHHVPKRGLQEICIGN